MVSAVADPPEPLLNWATRAFGEDATVVSAVGLHEGASPWLLKVVTPDATTEAVLRTAFDPPRWPGDAMSSFKLARGAAALRVAEQHGLAAPRLIACDVDGREAGHPASLETVLPGNSGCDEPPTAAGWRDAGAAVARLHRVTLQPQEHILLDPFLRSAFRDGLFRRVATERSAPLLRLANEAVRRYERPRRDAVLLHGDLWLGNVMWIGDTCTGLIDWKEAKIGDPGIELANLRYVAALHLGPEGALLAQQGWEDEIGREATDVAYWDTVWAIYSWNALDDESLLTNNRGAAFLQAAVDELI